MENQGTVFIGIVSMLMSFLCSRMKACTSWQIKLLWETDLQGEHKPLQDRCTIINTAYQGLTSYSHIPRLAFWDCIIYLSLYQLYIGKKTIFTIGETVLIVTFAKCRQTLFFNTLARLGYEITVKGSDCITKSAPDTYACQACLWHPSHIGQVYPGNYRQYCWI